MTTQGPHKKTTKRPIKKAITIVLITSKLMLANASERRIMHNRTNSNDLQEIVTQALEEIKESQGKNFDINKVNLAEMAHKTGLSRRILRTLKKNDFIVRPNAHLGQKPLLQS